MGETLSVVAVPSLIVYGTLKCLLKVQGVSTVSNPEILRVRSTRSTYTRSTASTRSTRSAFFR